MGRKLYVHFQSISISRALNYNRKWKKKRFVLVKTTLSTEKSFNTIAQNEPWKQNFSYVYEVLL